MRNGVTTVAIVGYGRAGKDTAAEWLHEHTNMVYNGATSNIMNPLVALATGKSLEESYRTRHDNRRFWKDFCDRFRYGQDEEIDRLLKGPMPEEIRNSRTVRDILKDPAMVLRADPAKIIRLSLLLGTDIVAGIRGDVELFEARDRGLLDLIIWIENPRVPADFTVDFKKEDCDVVVLNEAGRGVFYSRLARLASSLKGVTLKAE